MVPNEEISPLFDATAWATEEAIVNALVAAETMTGADNRRVERLPHDRLREVLQKYNRRGAVEWTGDHLGARARLQRGPRPGASLTSIRDAMRGLPRARLA